MTSYYITSGDSDFMLLVDTDDSANLVPALMVAGASGTVSNLKTVRAYTSAEFLAAQKKAGELASAFKSAG
jgi:uncharacterized protein with GYD domain